MLPTPLLRRGVIEANRRYEVKTKPPLEFSQWRFFNDQKTANTPAAGKMTENQKVTGVFTHNTFAVD
ncbi:hypothetical protein YEP4_10764 [Yersinia enterocolitica subsp. palearctica YE-P4]|uniref:Uncharacterized protein n=1 Tax=Yersinia enterocolitica subsp. palearctica serotype O:3 (strain DSM 13030 / CIP 106945 / Y11) TaxID=930944 RepID=A0A0H3NLD3_YERE1|nr:hypothetical protein [Yersinia enterocolitica]EOR81883.1 hypothetical protein YEP4_10764 [Yersinia enterocolitica subsp. palearctica YE-P4]QBQ00231.1 hypothetical protein YEY1_16560 [Yersinia enterocolitica subsp. palearctica]CBY25936.1 hypothetical protein Y11_22451 [Yersinia enterocolitica subsp. palearctica Y11]CCO70305.1 hypothetical protein D322_3448 [Yersinia enterocolitica IP 10393]